MKSVLVPIDDSADSEWAVRHVIQLYRSEPVKVFLLNVQTPLSNYVSRFINKQDIRDFHHENGLRLLRPRAAELDAAGVPHNDLVLIGHKAETIARFARENGFNEIVLPKSHGLLHGLGSIGGQLRHLIGAESACSISEVY
jgi:nucleotide-binding universal stress UspA family protein